MNVAPKGRPGYLNYLNQSRIFKLVRDLEQTSRTQLSQQTGLSIPTISRAIQNLEKSGLVQSFEKKVSGKKGGRPPVMIRFQSHNNYAIGIDLEKDRSHCILADMSGKIKEYVSWETPPHADLSRMITLACQNIKRLMGKIPSHAYFRGVGIAVPGLVNRKEGNIEYSHTFNWKNVKFADLIEDKLSVPVFIDNEANLLSLGELYYGSGKTYRNFICVDIRYGIGCGVVYHHRLLDIPGELGQICLSVSAKKDMEGNILNLEERASDHAILQKAETVIRNHPDSTRLSSYPTSLTITDFIHALERGDSEARAIFNEALTNLGTGLAFLVNIFHPEAFIFHGPITVNNPLFYSQLRQIIETCSLSPFSASLDLKPSSFRRFGAASGAVSMILYELLELNPALFNPS